MRHCLLENVNRADLVSRRPMILPGTMGTTDWVGEQTERLAIAVAGAVGAGPAIGAVSVVGAVPPACTDVGHLFASFCCWCWLLWVMLVFAVVDTPISWLKMSPTSWRRLTVVQQSGHVDLLDEKTNYSTFYSYQSSSIKLPLTGEAHIECIGGEKRDHTNLCLFSGHQKVFVNKSNKLNGFDQLGSLLQIEW